MKTALIGYTGFVGSNLMSQIDIKYLYNSSNIQSICEHEYDIVYCAAPSAVKWLANKEPIQDLELITRLLHNLQNLKTKKFVLFSTVDVYGNEIDKSLNERYIPNLLETHAYGKNRYVLESYISNMFDSHIIRLPALFGQNLKKNIIFDLKTNNMLNNISLDTEYQWFDLSRLNEVINIALTKNITVLNIATEPIKTRSLVELYFPEKLFFCNGTSELKYDIKTLFSQNGYLYDKSIICSDLKEYFK